MLCPSDVVDNYAGWPQRETVIAMPKHAPPPLAAVNCPAPPDGGGCACSSERCIVNYGWDGMHPDLHIAKTDLIPDTLENVWTICKDREITHLIYMGVHTQVCLLGKPMGLRNLKAAGMPCILARDITNAHPGYNPATGFTPDGHTAEVVAHFERCLGPHDQRGRGIGQDREMGSGVGRRSGAPSRLGHDQTPASVREGGYCHAERTVAAAGRNSVHDRRHGAGAAIDEVREATDDRPDHASSRRGV